MSTVSFRTAANGCASALAIACLLLLAFSEKGVAQTIIPRVPLMEVAHPPDPTGDFVWSGGFGGARIFRMLSTGRGRLKMQTWVFFLSR